MKMDTGRFVAKLVVYIHDDGVAQIGLNCPDTAIGR